MDVKKYPLKVTLHKFGEMIYFSQLDLVKILERALRRAQLPLYFTQGYSPRVKLSFSNGLKLGVEGRIGVTFYFTENILLESLLEKLARQLPQGLEIITEPLE
ncbi:MAG: TIGR03936 family radical SAM-associated protein [Candidatus Omnitrophica bacterium]|nr:TIGR03936 family radical SAM-associated protein [Candidatus Omnitrophota bacterium]